MPGELRDENTTTMTKIMPIPEVTLRKQGNVNNTMSLRKSNSNRPKMVAMDEKERADRIVAAEAMSALSSMVILTPACSVNEHETVKVVTRGTSPINIPVISAKSNNKREEGISKISNTRTRGIPETLLCMPVVQAREIQTASESLSNTLACNADSKKQDLENENSIYEKTLPLKKRALVREEIQMDKLKGAASKKEERDSPDVQNLPSGTELISGNSEPRSQDLASYRQVPVDPRVSLSALTELAYVWKADEDGDLPLHIAVVHENIKLVERFVHIMVKVAGRSVDKFNKTQQTPLHLAVELNFKEAVQCLLLVGSNPNLVDKRGHSAVHLAVKNQFADCLSMLLSDSKAKVELNSRNFEGFAPIHTAVCNKNISILKQLLDAGADIETIDGKSGRSSLFHAVETNQMEIVEELQSRGANCDLPNYAGVTPLMAAQARNHHAVASVMLKGPESRMSGETPDNIREQSSSPPVRIQVKVAEHLQMTRTTTAQSSPRVAISKSEPKIDDKKSAYTILQSDPSRIPSVVSSKLSQELRPSSSDKTQQPSPSLLNVKGLLAQQLQRQHNEKMATSNLNMPAEVIQKKYFQQLMRASMPRIPHGKQTFVNHNSALERMDTSDTVKIVKHVSEQDENRINSASERSQGKVAKRMADVSDKDIETACSSAMPKSPLLWKALIQDDIVKENLTHVSESGCQTTGMETQEMRSPSYVSTSETQKLVFETESVSELLHLEPRVKEKSSEDSNVTQNRKFVEPSTQHSPVTAILSDNNSQPDNNDIVDIYLQNPRC